MYLSRLELAPLHRSVRRDVADCHAMHRRLMSAFPDTAGELADPRRRFGVLYRVEIDSHSGRVHVVVQSGEEPDWDRLPDGYLEAREGNPGVKDISALRDVLKVGQILAFRLQANPTRKIDTKSTTEGGRRNGRRVPIRDEEGLYAWLLRKGDACGFALLEVSTDCIPNTLVRPGGLVRGVRSGNGKQQLTFAAVRFDGVLRITSLDRFRSALVGGIGTAKAYGHGLLSIAPAYGRAS